MEYQISSGQGPAECELGVAKFLWYLVRKYNVTMIDFSPGYNEGTYRSARIYSAVDLSFLEGSIKWICPSPYRPNHKRKNWFLDFSRCSNVLTEDFDESQVRFDTFRSSGKGGQNVNKVESGVRATYNPTGDAVVCTEERSQFANKQKAIAQLRDIINKKNESSRAAAKNSDWSNHNHLKRGEAVATFKGMNFKEV